MFQDNKYTRYYNRIVSQARADVNNRVTGYYEHHHIIPRSMGGPNTKSNVVKLTAREHFICHLLLTKMTDDRGMKLALIKMTAGKHGYQERYICSSRLYDYARRLASEANSGANNGMYGRNIHQGRPEIGQKIAKSLAASTAFKESRASSEFKQKVSDRHSEAIVLLTTDGKIHSRWKSHGALAIHLGCTRAAVSNAMRKGYPLGKRAGLSEPCYVKAP
jgi:hypothetical protein